MTLRNEQAPDASTGRLPKITNEEYLNRVHGLQKLMERSDLDAVVLTSEDNFTYITGFFSPTWVNLTRPRYCIVPRNGNPVLILPANNKVIADHTSWITDIRTWIAPCPEDDGISLLVEGVRACLKKSKRVGMEFGPESRLTMPIGDFLKFRESQELQSVEFVDGFHLVLSLRMVKSAAEISRIRNVAQITSRSFENLAPQLKLGDTERAAGVKLRLDLINAGADTIPYLTGGAGSNGYSSVNLALADRILESGDVLTIDTGSTLDGYFCDFNRQWAFGTLSDDVKRAYVHVWKSTEAGLAAVRPGMKASDIWRAMADALASPNGSSQKLGAPLRQSGRFGHGIGLRLCEPPSVSEHDNTILTAGMVITLEPSVAFRTKVDGGPATKIMLHEENIVVTDNGYELLTTRAPAELPIVG